MYQVADGHNNADNLAILSPQPATPDAIQYPQIRYAADGSAVFHGAPYIDVVWSSLTREQYNDLMTAHGLSQTVASNAVTVAVRGDDDTFANYNATAVHLKSAKRGMAFWTQLTIRYRNLEALA